MIITRLFKIVGHATVELIQFIGSVSIFVARGILSILFPPFFFRIFLKQLFRVAYFSLPVVALTAFFTGGTLALQINYGTNHLDANSVVANIVGLGITRELSPVLAGLMVAGRLGAAYAAEIGTMRITEQIDALVTLSVNPFQYLFAPRLLACIIGLPFLVLIGDIVGIMGGFLSAVHSMHANGPLYIQNTINFLKIADITSGLIKAACFGFVIAVMGCYHGFHSDGGAQGVGQATTKAVVSASIFILAINYILTSLFFF